MGAINESCCGVLEISSIHKTNVTCTPCMFIMTYVLFLVWQMFWSVGT